MVQCLPGHDAAVSVVVFVCLVSCLCLCDCVFLCLSVVIRDPVHARSRYCRSVIRAGETMRFVQCLFRHVAGCIGSRLSVFVRVCVRHCVFVPFVCVSVCSSLSTT